jgi:hypothetical protein
MNFTNSFLRCTAPAILGVILTLVSSCKTNPPTEPEVPQVDKGMVYITANVTGAQIFLDDVNTEKVTPDTIEATIGNHELRLQKENYLSSVQMVEVLKDSVIELTFSLEETVPRIVLLEDFANVSCIPCVQSNKITESLINNTYGHNKLVAVKYPTNWPSPIDPFYLANSEACDLRISYYSIQVAPTIIIDGTQRPISTDSIGIKEAVDQQLQETSLFSLEVSDSIAGSNYFITVTIKVLDGSGLDFSNIVLHTVVTETDIEFANPPGSNGETKFYDVMRVMLPSNAGESLNGISQTEEVVYQRQTSINPIWVVNHINTVAFIQNISTKVVYQAGSTFD